MSKQIENNVVQMTFDNKDFEKNISTSSKSIDKLNEQLKFKDANKGFQDLQKYANSVNFSGLEKAINNINSVFTVTGNLAHKIVDDIAGYFESKIVGTISSVKNKISYIMDTDLGVQKYEQYTTAINTMSANLADADVRRFADQVSKGIYEFGEEYKYAEKYIERMALFTDETSYSLTDMVDTMAKFAAANVPLDQSSKAMMGFANMAAVAGQNAKTATSSMYQMAQAFSTGYIRYQDWQQAFGLKNLATKEAKQIFLQEALKAGTVDQKLVQQAMSELGAENYASWFYTSKSLNEGQWLTTDVLVSGLQKYSKASDEILSSMEKIGERVSVTDMLDWAKAYKKAGGDATEFAKALASQNSQIDNVDALAESLKKLASEEYELGLKAFEAAQKATNFHEAIDAVRDAVGTKMMYAMKYFIGDLEQAKELWTSFANSLWDIFAAPIDNALEGLETWNSKVYEVNEETGEMITYYEKFWSSVGAIFTGIGDIFGGFMNRFRMITGAIELEEDGMVTVVSVIEKYTLSFMENLTHKVTKLAEYIEKFLQSKFYRNLTNSFAYIVMTLKDIKKILGTLFGATAGTAIKNFGKPLTEISDIIFKITQQIFFLFRHASRSERLTRISDVLSKLTKKLVELGATLIRVFGNLLVKKLGQLFDVIEKIFDFLWPWIDKLLTLIEDKLIPVIDNLIEGPYSIEAGLEFLGRKLDWAKDKIKDFLENVSGLSFEEAKNKITDFADHAAEKLSYLGGGIFDILKEYFKTNFSSGTKGSLPDLFERLSEANGLVAGAQSTVKWTGDAVMRPIQLILDIVGFLTGTDLTNLANGISTFVHAITDTVANVTPDVLSFVEKIGDILLKILKFVANLVIDIIKYTAGMKDTTGFVILDDIIYAIKTLLRSLIDTFVYLLKTAADASKYITPAIKKVFSLIKEVVVYFVNLADDTVKTLKNIKDPSELASYALKLLKIGLGFLILSRVAVLIMDVIYFFDSLGGFTRLIGKSVHVVSDSFAGLLDSLAGDSWSGMLRMFALVLFSFGYALSNLVKIGTALADPKVRNGVIIAFTGVLLLLTVISHYAKSLVKAQVKAQKGYAKFLVKKNAIYNVDDLTVGFKGLANVLMGLAIALIGISAAVALLARVTKNTGKEEMNTALSGIMLMILVLGLFAKLAAVQQKTRRDIAVGTSSLFSRDFEGKSYKGLAGALIGFAAVILAITPSISILAYAAKRLGNENIEFALEVIIKVLTVMEIGMVFMAKFANNTGFLASFGIVRIIRAMSSVMIAIGIEIALLSLVMTKLIPKEDYGIVEKLGKFMLIALGIISAVIIFMSLKSSNADLKTELKQLVVKLSKLILISFVFSSLSITIGVMMASLLVLINVCNKMITDLRFAGRVGMALAMLVILLGMVTFFINVIAKAIDTKGSTDWKAILAKVAGMAIIIALVSVVLVTITKVVTILAAAITAADMVNNVALGNDGKKVSNNLGKATLAVMGILLGLTAFIAAIAAIGKWLAKGRGDNDDNPSMALIKLAGALVIVSAAITIVASSFILIAKALNQLSGPEILKGLLAISGAIVILLGTLLGLGVIDKFFHGVVTTLVKLLKVLMIAFLAVTAAVLIFGKSGDKIAEWLRAAEPKIREGFRALGNALETAIEGFNLALPKVLEGLAETIAIILVWIAENIQDWTAALAIILARVVEGLCDALFDEGNELGAALARLLNGILDLVVTFLDQTLGTNISEWTKGFLEDQMRFLWYSLPGVGQIFLAADTLLHEEEKDNEIEHQKEMYEVRREGALAYMKLLEKLSNAQDELAAKEANNGLLTTAERARLQTNVNYWQKQVDDMVKTTSAEEVFAKYGIDVRKKSYDQVYWWKEFDPDYNYKLGFTGGENGNLAKLAEKFGSYYDWEMLVLHGAPEMARKYGTGQEDRIQRMIDNMKPNFDLSTLGVFEKDAKNKTADSVASLFDAAKKSKSVLGSAKETGENWLDALVNAIKDKGKSAKDYIASIGGLSGLIGLKSEDGNILGQALGDGTIEGMTGTLGGIKIEDLMAQVNANTPSVDSVRLPDATELTVADGSNLMYNGDLDFSGTNNSALQTATEFTQNTGSIVDGINRTNDKLDELKEAILGMTIVLDDGTLVGRMDSQLGKKSNRKEGRGW